MKVLCSRVAAWLVVVCVAQAAMAQVVIYEQTFNPPSDPLGYTGAIEDSGWVVEPLAYQGTYNSNYGIVGLYDAQSGDPINGNTGVYIGTGGPVTSARGMFYTTDGSGGYTTIDPATCARLRLSIFANTQGGGLDDLGYFAVQLGDGDPRTGDEAWYVSATPMAMPTENQGNFMNFRSLLYDTSPGAWRSLTLGPPTPGALAGDLSGLLITGVGIVQEVTNGSGDFSSWNYADYRIICAPEPTGLWLIAVAAPAWIALRRSRR
jgi:hypothetical protein